MSDTSGERLARQVRRACGPYNDPEFPVVQIVLDLKEKADRLAAIERQVIYGVPGVPQHAFAWMKDIDTDGEGWWLIKADWPADIEYWPAPDYRPGEPGPLFLPIIDAHDVGGEDT